MDERKDLKMDNVKLMAARVFRCSLPSLLLLNKNNNNM